MPFGADLPRLLRGLFGMERSVEERIYAVCREAERRDIGALTPAQRTVVLAWGGRGILSNGGFKYFYEAEWRGAELAAAYRTLGFPEAADACDRSLDAFPNREPPHDQAERWSHFTDEAKTLWDGLTKPIYAVKWPDLQAAIGKYMEREAEEFRRF
jgi:hypothetical protein